MYKIIRFQRTIIATTIIFIVVLMIFSDQITSIHPINRIVMQAQVIYNYFYFVIDGINVNYGYLAFHYGKDALSGIWRLEHWSNIIYEFFNAPSLNILFGHGIGSTRVIFNTLPHNEYLRILFEQGMIGLSLFSLFYLTVLKKTLKRYRYIILMFLIFSFTENNLDNFFYMSLLMIFMATHQHGSYIHTTVNKALVQPVK